MNLRKPIHLYQRSSRWIKTPAASHSKLPWVALPQLELQLQGLIPMRISWIFPKPAIAIRRWGLTKTQSSECFGGGKRCIKKASIIFVWSLKLANMFRRIEFHLCFPHPLYRVTDLCAQESMECSFDTYAWSHVPRGLPGPPERKMHETWWMWKSWLNDFVLSIQRMEWWKHVTCFFTKYP